MSYNPNDHYFKKAKKEGFLARSAYKLEEIQKKYNLLENASKVLDLGAAPGSWTQFVLQKLKKPKIIAIDLQEIKVSHPDLIVLQEDIYNVNWEKLKKENPDFFPIDTLISDMAPQTTGIRNTDQLRSAALCEMALFVAKSELKKNGNFVCKIFESGEVQNFRKQMQEVFTKVMLFKPKSTRKNSKEIFVIGINKKQ